ncbi:MAG: DUF4881 domain-containing protein [Deltaproteobacteria bacterium]|nr:MAG: DUF4881 domain-containing protein [Deltaproteobacteria bacterium]
MARHMIFIILLAVLAASGCDKFGQDQFGKVDQGRVIAFDKNERTIVMLRDQSQDVKKPDYTALPPVSYKLPDDLNETGPAPKAGKLMNIDLEKKEAVIFVESSNSLSTINITIVEEKKKVDPKDPLVFDPDTKKNRAFPVFDQQKKTISLYLEKNKTLLTFAVPDEYFAMPPESWTLGDEVRVYYKEPGKSLRFMNVSKTDIFKK